MNFFSSKEVVHSIYDDSWPSSERSIYDTARVLESMQELKSLYTQVELKPIRKQILSTEASLTRSMLQEKAQSKLDAIWSESGWQYFEFYRYLATIKPKLQLRIPDSLVKWGDESVMISTNSKGRLSYKNNDALLIFQRKTAKTFNPIIKGVKYRCPLYTHKAPGERSVAIFDDKKARFLWKTCPHRMQVLQAYVIPSSWRTSVLKVRWKIHHTTKQWTFTNTAELPVIERPQSNILRPQTAATLPSSPAHRYELVYKRLRGNPQESIPSIKYHGTDQLLADIFTKVEGISESDAKPADSDSYITTSDSDSAEDEQKTSILTKSSVSQAFTGIFSKAIKNFKSTHLSREERYHMYRRTIQSDQWIVNVKKASRCTMVTRLSQERCVSQQLQEITDVLRKHFQNEKMVLQEALLTFVWQGQGVWTLLNLDRIRFSQEVLQTTRIHHETSTWNTPDATPVETLKQRLVRVKDWSTHLTSSFLQKHSFQQARRRNPRNNSNFLNSIVSKVKEGMGKYKTNSLVDRFYRVRQSLDQINPTKAEFIDRSDISIESKRGYSHTRNISELTTPATMLKYEYFSPKPMKRMHRVQLDQDPSDHGSVLRNLSTAFSSHDDFHPAFYNKAVYQSLNKTVNEFEEIQNAVRRTWSTQISPSQLTHTSDEPEISRLASLKSADFKKLAMIKTQSFTADYNNRSMIKRRSRDIQTNQIKEQVSLTFAQAASTASSKRKNAFKRSSVQN